MPLCGVTLHATPAPLSVLGFRALLCCGALADAMLAVANLLVLSVWPIVV